MGIKKCDQICAVIQNESVHLREIRDRAHEA